MTVSLPSSTEPARDSRTSLLPAKVRPAIVTVGAFGAVLVVAQVVNMAMGYRMNAEGIVPRTVGGLWGILDAPLLHTGWGHLAANIVPLLIFGFLIMVGGVRQFVAVTVLVWLISGFGVWLTAHSGSVTVGASGLVFGWLAYLVARGVFTRQIGQILIGLVLLALWGGVFWGLLPSANGVSWQAHVFGAVGGVLAAFLVAKADGPSRPKKATAAAG